MLLKKQDRPLTTLCDMLYSYIMSCQGMNIVMQILFLFISLFNNY